MRIRTIEITLDSVVDTVTVLAVITFAMYSRLFIHLNMLL